MWEAKTSDKKVHGLRSRIKWSQNLEYRNQEIEDRRWKGEDGLGGCGIPIGTVVVRPKMSLRFLLFK
jgi:hypothetical protein